jgi:hypothetical protein
MQLGGLNRRRPSLLSYKNGWLRGMVFSLRPALLRIIAPLSTVSPLCIRHLLHVDSFVAVVTLVSCSHYLQHSDPSAYPSHNLTSSSGLLCLALSLGCILFAYIFSSQ